MTFDEWYQAGLCALLPPTVRRRYLCASCGRRTELAPAPVEPWPEAPGCCGWDMVELLPVELVA